MKPVGTICLFHGCNLSWSLLASAYTACFCRDVYAWKGNMNFPPNWVLHLMASKDTKIYMYTVSYILVWVHLMYTNSGPAEAKLNRSGWVRGCMHMHAEARGVLWRKFFKFGILKSLLRPFWTIFSLICSSRQAGFWFNLAHLWASNIHAGILPIRTSHIFTQSQTPAAQNSCSCASNECCSQGRTMLH